MSTQSMKSRNQIVEPVQVSRMWLAGVIGIVGAVTANLLVRVLLFAFLPLPAEFPPLQAGPIVMFTGFGTLLAVGVYALTVRFSARPLTVFRWIALAALIVSILPNIALMANPAAIPFPFPGASGLAFGALIVFHIVAALVCVLALTGLTRKTA